MKSGVNGLDHRLSFRRRNSALLKHCHLEKRPLRGRNLNGSERDKYDQPGHWLAFSELDWSIPIPGALIINLLQISSFHSAKLTDYCYFSLF